MASFINEDNMVRTCLLQNEFTVTGCGLVAVPFLMRSYKPTGFDKERVQIKVSFQQVKENGEEDTHEELHRFVVTERFQPVVLLRAFEPLISREANLRRPTIKLIPNFKRYFVTYLRPNYLGDAETLINRLCFKSNLGKVTLEKEGDSLEFDPVEIPERQKSVDLLVFTYTMANMNKVSLANPHDLSYTFSFKLRLVSDAAIKKLEEEELPKKLAEKEEAEEEVNEEELKEAIAEVNALMGEKPDEADQVEGEVQASEAVQNVPVAG